MKKFLLALGLVGFLMSGAAAHAEEPIHMAGDDRDWYPVTVAGKEFKNVPVYKSGDAFSAPASLLEKGGRWKIVEKEKGTDMAAETDEASDKPANKVTSKVAKKTVKKVTKKTAPKPVEKGLYVSLSLEDGENELVPIPSHAYGGEKFVDIGLFAKPSGLDFSYDETKKQAVIQVNKEDREKAAKKKNKKNKHSRKAEENDETSRRITLMWDPDRDFDPSKPYFSSRAGTRVIAPSWGAYTIFAKEDVPYYLPYIRNLLAHGFEITPLIHNDFDPEATAEFIRDEKAVDRLASQMTAYAIVYSLTGYNMDFENMDPEDKSLYTDFIETLAKKLHEAGKQISVNITANVFPDSYWTGCYDRKGLADIVDYEVFMGYDQTAGGSLRAGPVASADWLETNIEKLLTEIPEDKLILGMPFYTRVWTGWDGRAHSAVLTERYVEEYLSKHHLTPRWLKKEKQFHIDTKINGVPVKSWLEEQRSIGEKIELARQYKLLGIAFWRYGFEQNTLYANLESVWEGLSSPEESLDWSKMGWGKETDEDNQESTVTQTAQKESRNSVRNKA
jgi:opacity protein-like surface antigen